MKILCGDIGGTHCRLAMAAWDGRRVVLERAATLATAGQPDPYAVLAAFLESETEVEACCMAVAGPTDGRVVRFTNLAWHLDAGVLSARFGIPRTSLVNDFAAVGWGLDCLDPDQSLTLQAGEPRTGAPRLALGAGTGLGVGLVTWRGDHYRPLDSEGGHIGFAPVSAEQDRLLDFLRRRLGGRVSVERILSGPGLVDLYRFCLADAGLDDTPALAAERPAQAISRAGLEDGEPAARRALALFAAILGQTAGDLALACRAEGGVYLAGGIAPKLRQVLEDGTFLTGFRAKGRFAAWMEKLPVTLVLDPDIGLKGAALAAIRA